MNDTPGMIFSCALDGTGNARELTWPEVKTWSSQKEILWTHCERTHSDIQHWLQEESGINPLVVDALLAEETRPRITIFDDSFLLILRGVNFNPGAEPDDMVSIRLFVDAYRIVSVRHRPVMTIQDIHASFANHSGPISPGDFLAVLTDRLMERMAPVIGQLDEEIDDIEDQMIEQASHQLRSQLGILRRQAISLRRYIAPQREVISQLQLAPVTWLSAAQRARIREVADYLIRYVEDLDAARERMGVMQEELTGKLSEQMNKTMYILTVLAGIFLPITFVTGLLGINVGGIPGSENPWAFIMVCITLTSAGLLLVGIFRWLKWL